MATSFFQSISNALTGAGKSSPAPASADGNSRNTSGSQVFDHIGNPVNGSENTPSNPVVSNPTPVVPSSTPEPASVEDLLFAPPASAEPPPAGNKESSTDNQSAKQGGEQEIAPGLTAAQLVKNLGSVNFLAAVPAETVQSALGGDVQAFNQVISSAAQLSAALAVQQAITASNSILDTRFKDFDSSLASKIGESRYSEILADPKFSNPFIRPLAENLINKLRERDPSITPDQIKQTLPNLIQYAMSKSDFNQTAPASSPTPTGQNKNVPREVNFDELF